MNEDRQLDVLRLYGELVSAREDWGGALVLACGEGAEAVGPAVSIAGGTTLLVSEDAAGVKAAMRRGELDFVVNTLDESLRVVKNQIRQRKAVSVGLVMNRSVAFTEMGERGVLPDLVLNGVVSAKKERAAMVVRKQRYFASHVEAASLQELRAVDEKLLADLAEDDAVRRRWLQRIPAYVRDSPRGGRWAWLTEEERTSFTKLRITAESR